ncbi:Putative esterase [Planctomicrobium piriforme]|uniref:Putative esterase n=2 Tax=Planctomicrobium piriforme TaxID=1576369 RepID=A0A1I3GXT3_9PLAN|nr:Putative esterase [Planctomicrobium piriforme]
MLSAFCLCGVLAASAAADDVVLKNGLTLHGTAVRVAGLTSAIAKQNNGGPVPNSSFWMIDDGVRRYFVFRRNVLQSEDVADLGSIVSFKMQQEKRARTAGFPSVGGFSSVQPFDEFGRRTVTLPTQKGVIPVIQAITEMRPDYSTLDSLTHVWEYNIDTRSLPTEVVQSIIEKSSDRNDPAERKAAVLFYVQAQLYDEAREELRQITERFPELKDWCAEYQRRLDEYVARRAMNEIERRQAAGQHALASQYAQKFPAAKVSADVSRRAQEIQNTYEQALADRDRVLMQLDLLQADLPPKQSDRLKSLRAILHDELHYELMDRLEPFLRATEDETVPAAEKLALAYSGWLLGNANAIVDLDETIRLWDARFQILEYLRVDQDPLRDQEILKELGEIEGISVERAALMLATLPLPFETTRPTAGELVEVEVPKVQEGPTVRYSLVLPPEYSPAHRYPLLVVLRGQRSKFAGEAKWWAGDETRPGWAQRRGYIVIAPHYCADDSGEYHPGAAEHEIVLRSLEHVRKRYRVDSDRIFLAGHAMGGDAVFDIALAHPGIFAGAIPIAGVASTLCRAYCDNDPNLAWYVVGGERDRNTLEQNSGILNQMMNHGQNMIYCDYKFRGFESFVEEQERIFEWMQSQRRTPLKEVVKWEAASLRKTDNRFYWLEADAIPDRFFPVIVGDKLPRPKTYEGSIGAKGGITVTHPGNKTTIWLSPEMFDFNNRSEVRVNLKYVYHDYIKPSLEALLTDVRKRGDREQLFWARLDL